MAPSIAQRRARISSLVGGRGKIGRSISSAAEASSPEIATSGATGASNAPSIEGRLNSCTLEVIGWFLFLYSQPRVSKTCPLESVMAA